MGVWPGSGKQKALELVVVLGVGGGVSVGCAFTRGGELGLLREVS